MHDLSTHLFISSGLILETILTRDNINNQFFKSIYNAFSSFSFFYIKKFCNFLLWLNMVVIVYFISSQFLPPDVVAAEFIDSVYLCDDAGLLPREDFGFVWMSLLDYSASSFDFIRSNGFELYLCWRVPLFPEINFRLFGCSQDCLDPIRDTCFMSSYEITQYFYYNLFAILFIYRQTSRIDIVLFQNMLNKIYKLLLMMVLVTNLKVECQNQYFNANQQLKVESDENLNKKLGQSGQLQNIAKQSTYIEVQPIEYLQNVLTLDTIIYFIYCNHTIPYEDLKQRTMGLINSRGNNNIKHIQLCYEEVINKKQQQQDKQQKNCCLFCGKQFKNSTYLAMHYLISHLNLFISNRKLQKKRKNYQISSKQSMENIIFRIISNPILEKISDIELNLLFSSSNPQTQTYQYCQFLFSNLFNTTSVTSEKWLQRYRQFIKNRQSSQLCNIIAYRMYQISIWTKIGKYVGFVVVIFSLLWWIMIRRQNRIQKQRMLKKRKYKFQRY